VFLTDETFICKVLGSAAELPQFSLILVPVQVFAGVVVEDQFGHSGLAGEDEVVAGVDVFAADALTDDGLVNDFVCSDDFTLFYHDDLVLNFTGFLVGTSVLVGVTHFVMVFDNIFHYSWILSILINILF